MKIRKMLLLQFHKIYLQLFQCNHNTLTDHIDRSKFTLLRGVIKGISRQPGRQSKPTNTLRNLLLKEIVKYKTFNFLNDMWKAMICFTKGFALRTGEYTPETQTPNIQTLQWSS